jgi:hypothetical protein
MKTTINNVRKALLIALVLMLPASHSAQDAVKNENRTSEEMAVSQTAAIADSLELTPEQTEKVKEINTDFIKKMQEAKGRKVPISEIRLLYKNRTDSVRQLLNVDQRKRWKEKAIRKHQEKELRKERIKEIKLRTEKNRRKNNGNK